MNDNDRAQLIWCITIIFIVLIICSTIVGCVRAYQQSQQVAMEKGYVEKPNVGQSGYHWEKQ